MIDTLLIRGNVHTLDPAKPRASAIALWRGRIVAVGGSELDALADQETRLYDLDGATVLPGFCDSHIHWSWVAQNMLAIDLFDVPSKEEALSRIAAAKSGYRPGEWIYGSGWAQGLWGGRFPTAADLDTVAPANPVYLPARSGHAVWVNSLALRLAGITAETPDPPQGQIQRDAGGKPTGILFEDANELVARHVPKRNPNEIADAMAQAQPAAWRTGLTAIHDYDRPVDFAAMQILHQRGELGLRIMKHINDPYIQQAFDVGLRSYQGDAWLRVGGLKMFADGALGSVTALMIDPYEGEGDFRGLAVTPKEEMERLAIEATKRGFFSTIHAIGDKAVRDVLDVYEKVRQVEAENGVPRESRRHRIEHLQLVHPDDVDRVGDLGIISSIQPIHATADMDMADKYWGRRARWGYNPRIGLERGLPVLFGSDAPVEPFDPLKGIHAAVTRRRADGKPGPDGWYPECRVTMDEAIRCYTVHPAYSAGLENELGRLKPGFHADLVVLDQDVYTIDPNDLLGVKVLGTMVAGEWKFGEF